MVKTIDPANPIAIVIHDKCRCGRLAVWLRTYGGNADYPGEPRLYCRACEYGPVETCDCAPEAAAQEQGAM